MINVNQITSQLARMPDPALQKYAEMHKNDPYVMALAMSEFNRRKQMRQGAQANAPEQPKVVDQAIQSMGAPMPENVGIGQLPAGNMNFAEGGIVAFGDGGEVERYQSGGQLGSAFSTFLKNTGQVSAYANGTPAQKAAIEAAFRTAVQGPFVPPAGAAPGAAPAAAAPAGAAPAASKIPLGRLAAGTGAAGIAAIPVGVAQGLVSAMQGMRDQGYTADPMGEFGTGAMTPEQAAFDESRRQEILRRQTANRAEDARLQAAVEGRQVPAAAAASNTPTTPPAAAPGAAAPAANAGPGTSGPRRNTGTPPPAGPAPAAARDDVIENLRKRVEPPKIDFTPSTAQPLDAQGILALQRQFEVNPDTVVDPLLERRQALAAALQSSAEENLATRQKQLAEMGVLGAERETRLKAREEKLGKQEKDLGPLAMLQAGFAMMSGASPYALKNIGIGAQAGLKTYSEGIDKLATAREKLDDAFGQLEIARRSERMMTDKEISGLRAGVKSAIIDGQKLFLDGADKAYGMAANKAQTAFNAVVQSKQREVDQAAEDRRKFAEMQSAGVREAMQQTGAGERIAAQLTVQERVAKMEADAKKAEAAATRAALERRDTAKTDQELIEIRAKSVLLQQRYPDVNEYLRIMKGTAALQAGQQLSPADQALIQKYLKP